MKIDEDLLKCLVAWGQLANSCAYFQTAVLPEGGKGKNRCFFAIEALQCNAKNFSNTTSCAASDSGREDSENKNGPLFQKRRAVEKNKKVRA